MRDYPFNYDDLFTFSNSNPYEFVSEEHLILFENLNQLKAELNFPAINNDIGSFISFMVPYWKPKNIFEMGSGYGHSAFWYLLSEYPCVENIVLTEKRTDLLEKFESLPWPQSWRDKIKYHNADAFEILDSVEQIDLALIDGVKGDYLKCLQVLESKMSKDGIVLIDNSYWRGSFLDKDLRETKQSAKNIHQLHEYVKNSKKWKSVFVPFKDGLTVLTLSVNI